MAIADEWQAVQARGRAYQTAARTFLFGVSHHAKGDFTGASDALLIPEAQKIFQSIDEFRVRNASRLPIAVLDAIDAHKEKYDRRGRGSGGIAGVTHLAAHVASAVEEISYLLVNTEASIVASVDRAFAHLQRSLVADDDIRAKWAKAFERGEVACERLGSVHLLLHGIWAFKVSAQGERTDLLLGDQLVVNDDVRRAAQGLILTEWKKLQDLTAAERLFETARAQADLYSQGCLAGFEAGKTRYIVVVSRQRCKPPVPPQGLNGIQYRYINIAVDPETPSRAVV